MDCKAVRPLPAGHADLLVATTAAHLLTAVTTRLLAAGHSAVTAPSLLTGKAAAHLRSSKPGTAARSHGRSSSSSSVAAATAYEGCAATAAATTGATAAVRRTAAATVLAASTMMIAARARHCRGGNRQRGYSRGEEQPGQHGNSPFEPQKRFARCTVPTPKRMERAGRRTSLNLKYRVCSDT